MLTNYGIEKIIKHKNVLYETVIDMTNIVLSLFSLLAFTRGKVNNNSFLNINHGNIFVAFQALVKR